ncbi:hypothetical protein [Orenia marismortui]|uniref:Uncharacterized protein n=1 Tax=Orenia marismortui TaxID=46469 RepID=A0A4R8GMA5_9FIRM|nr:hypothetical protein [Orenia marismortui]TDX44324.1 hypothetical protein C7959_15711 [Orenia marismortui]
MATVPDVIKNVQSIINSNHSINYEEITRRKMFNPISNKSMCYQLDGSGGKSERLSRKKDDTFVLDLFFFEEAGTNRDQFPFIQECYAIKKSLEKSKDLNSRAFKVDIKLKFTEATIENSLHFECRIRITGRLAA